MGKVYQYPVNVSPDAQYQLGSQQGTYGEVQRIRRIRTVYSNLQRICSRGNEQTGGTEYGNQLLC